MSNLKISQAALAKLIAQMDLTDADDMFVPEGMEEAMTLARESKQNPERLYTIGVPGLMEQWPVKGEPGYDQMVANAMIMERTLH